MNQRLARFTVAMAGTMAPDPHDRVLSMLYLATMKGEERRPAWWGWACWLALGITIARIEKVRRTR